MTRLSNKLTSKVFSNNSNNVFESDNSSLLQPLPQYFNSLFTGLLENLFFIVVKIENIEGDDRNDGKKSKNLAKSNNLSKLLLFYLL